MDSYWIIFVSVVQIEITVQADKIPLEGAIRDEITGHKEVVKGWHTYLIRKKSLDARSRIPVFRMRVDVFSGNSYPEKNPAVSFSAGKDATEVHIAGFGPAGMFAALQLLQMGIKPVVFERGKRVKERRRDLAILNKEGFVNEDSNYCFGEGGAGTFSDGKLYTRSNKRGDVHQVLQWLVMHGADERILYEAHPHIGTNKLPAIVENIRETILDGGGEIHFDTRITSLEVENNILKGIFTNNGFFSAQSLILATGHSARDIFVMLKEADIAIEAKPFALGVRIEHPQQFVDQAQYHCEERPVWLPPSAYSLVQQVNGRGVFSFCMCPGGIIAPSATQNGEIVVNGWSPSKRNGRFANSGMVVSVEPEDWKKYEAFGPLAAMKYQQVIEQKAYEMAGSNGMTAPAQRTIDFVHQKKSFVLPETSYIPGVKSIMLDELLPSEISGRLREALKIFDKKMKGYLHPESVLIAPESRTSSPVRIPRDRNTLQHPQISGLFPCGEGAGYAGGIVSAAIDGMKCAEMSLDSEDFLKNQTKKRESTQ